MTLQEFDETLISVSKLCCPVCWDTLELLRGDSGKFKVRGHHAVLSPVQLPFWTSNHMMKKMVRLYEERLIEQIKILMSSEDGWRSRANSLQSNAGLSTDGSNETSGPAVRGWPKGETENSSKPSGVNPVM